MPLPDETTPLQSGAEGGEKKKWLLEQLQDRFGWRFLALLVCAQHVTKGFTKSFTGAGQQYIMQAYSVKASRMGVYAGIISLPWALKPAIGVVSDTVPIAGYSKLPYMLVTTAIGVGALVVLGTVRHSLELTMVVILLFCFELYVSTADLLSEAIYARVLRAQPGDGPGLLSFIWGGMTMAGLLATVASGVMLSHGSPWALYMVGIIPASVIIGPVVFNWMGDVRMSQEDIDKQRKHVWKQKEAVLLAFVMMAATGTLTWSGFTLTTKQNAYVSVAVMLVTLFMFSVTLNPTIAKANAFSLIQTSLGVSAGGASFYFAMDTKEEYPEGPHFSIFFYSMILPLCGGIFTMVGIFIYNQYAASWTYQKMFIIGNLVASFVACFDLIFYLRLNTKWGINDHVFVLGSASLQSVILQWLWMPSVVLMAQMCPKGMEAIMYANLAGCHNIGATIASNIGAYVLEILHVNPSGEKDESEQFTNLWIVAALGIVMPLLPVVLVPWFIPNKLNTEKVFDREDTPANEGSLWLRWTGAAEDTTPA